MRRVLTILVVLLALGAVGCGESNFSGSDGSIDGGIDATLDGSDQFQPDQRQPDQQLDQTDTVLTAETEIDTTSDVPPEPTGSRVVWDEPQDKLYTAQTFFNVPWPESQRYDSDGTIALGGFPNPTSGDTCKLNSSDPSYQLLINAIKPVEYRQYIIDVADRHLRGFGNNQAVYFRFSGPISIGNLPSVQQSTNNAAKVFLINVSTGSPDYGKRVPISSRLLSGSRYVPDNVLAMMPWPGFPLRPNERYAAVVLRSLNDNTGKALELDNDFAELKSSSGDGPREMLYREVFETLEKLGVGRKSIAGMTVFRTADPVAPLKSVVDRVNKLDKSLAGITISSVKATANFYQVSGSITLPLFQKGLQPHLPEVNLIKFQLKWNPDDDSGSLLTDGELDTSDTPDVNRPRLERVSFVLTLPNDPLKQALQSGQPTASLPLVVVGHGTGGSRTSFINDGTAKVLSPMGFAVLSIDAVAHGERIDPEDLQFEVKEVLKTLGYYELFAQVLKGGGFFYNFTNAFAGNGNVQQSALDYIWLARVFRGIQQPIVINQKSVQVNFDPARIFFFGHSQGATTGPLTVLSPDVRALFLSAGGGHLIQTALTKNNSGDELTIRDIVAYGVCDGDLDIHHPILTLLQLIGEPADGLNYIPYGTRWANSAGFKHIFATEGVLDQAVTPQTVEALTTAGHLRLIGPELKPVLGQTLLGLSLQTADLAGNLGGFTAGFKQYTCDNFCQRDHFVSFYVPRAKEDWRNFFLSLLNQPPPTIPYSP